MQPGKRRTFFGDSFLEAAFCLEGFDGFWIMFFYAFRAYAVADIHGKGFSFFFNGHGLVCPVMASEYPARSNTIIG